MRNTRNQKFKVWNDKLKNNRISAQKRTEEELLLFQNNKNMTPSKKNKQKIAILKMVMRAVNQLFHFDKSVLRSVYNSFSKTLRFKSLLNPTRIYTLKIHNHCVSMFYLALKNNLHELFEDQFQIIEKIIKSSDIQCDFSEEKTRILEHISKGLKSMNSSVSVIASCTYVKMDINKTGVVDRDAFIRFFPSLLKDWTMKELHLIDLFSALQDQQISQISQRHEWESYAKQVYQMYTIDGVYPLSKREAKIIAKKLGQNNQETKTIVAKFIQQIDSNYNRGIDFQEFAYWLSQLMQIDYLIGPTKKDVDKLKKHFPFGNNLKSPQAEWRQYAYRIHCCLRENKFDRQDIYNIARKFSSSSQSNKYVEQLSFSDQPSVTGSLRIEEVSEFVIWLRNVVNIKEQEMIIDADVQKLKKKIPLLELRRSRYSIPCHLQ